MSLERFSKEGLEAAIKMRNRHAKTEEITNSVKTGFINLDKNRGGLKRGETYLLAGRPAMGKTAFVLNLIKNIAIDANQPVVYYLGQHNKYTIQNTLLKIVAFEGTQHGQKNTFDENELSIKKVIEAPIYYCESQDSTEADVFADILSERIAPALIVFDEVYGDLLTGKEYTRIARALNCPIIITRGISREVDFREEHFPTIYDIKDQGLVRTVNNVMILYRDDYYDNKTAYDNRAELYFAWSTYPGSGVETFSWSEKGMRVTEYQGNRTERKKDESTRSNEEPLLEDAIKYVKVNNCISIPLLKSKYGIGFNRAARMIDLLIEKGAIDSQPIDSYMVKHKSGTQDESGGNIL